MTTSIRCQPQQACLSYYLLLDAISPGREDALPRKVARVSWSGLTNSTNTLLFSAILFCFRICLAVSVQGQQAGGVR